jgi:hypothetical protein
MTYLYFLLTLSSAYDIVSEASVAYEWISPAEVRGRLLHDMDQVRSGGRFTSDWTRISLSPNDGGNAASGPLWGDLTPVSIALDEFIHAFEAVAHGSGDCLEALVYFAFRPSWYTPLSTEILNARECISVVFNRIPISVNQADEDMVYFGSLISDALSRLIRILYTEDADEVLATPIQLAPPANVTNDFFLLLNSSDAFKAILPLEYETPNIDEIIEFLFPIDAYYLRNMRDSLYNHSRMIHFPDFLDSVFVDLVSQSVNASVEAWPIKFAASRAALISAYEAENHARKYRAIENPGILFYKRSVGFQDSVSRKRNAYRQITAGSIQRLLDHESREIARNCMPRGQDDFKTMEAQFSWFGDERDESTFTIYMYYFMEKPGQLLQFYECILSGIASGAIHPTVSDLSKSGLGFLLRMVTSADAYYMRLM